jgi:amidase
MPGDMPDCAASAESTFPDLYESGILELQDGLEKGHFTSVDLVKVNSSKLWSI